MTQSRQLAAIMFTDIAGYTVLMEKDEQKAFELLKKNRDLQKSCIEKYRGRWIKEMGDGVLASFSTVTDAVMCAGAIQKAAETITDLKLRIGIHLGEVVFENNDVFGDGVNIASRLQALAPVGGIFVSEAIYKNVINKKEIASEFIREEILKNVSASVKIYEVKVESFPDVQKEAASDLKIGTGISRVKKRKIVFFIGALVVVVAALTAYFLFLKPKQVAKQPQPASKEKSIAVLPFVNMSNDPQQEYFSDGLSEELINMFTKIPGLKVMGRTSSFAYKGKNEDLRSIGQKLGVDYLLEGSVRKSGDKIRITAQLIKANEGTHLWSETYDKVMNNIFEVQDQISASVTNALRMTIFDKDKTTRQTKINPEAYNDFLKGKFYYEEVEDTSNIDKAMEWFKEAIKKDSSFSLPMTYLSMVYLRKSERTNDKLFNEAKQVAIKAFELDPASGIAAINVAEFLDYEYDFEGAHEKIELGLKLDPENSYVLRNAGRHYTLLGRKEESIAFCKKAIEKDPYQKTAQFYLFLAYYYAEQNKEAYDLGNPFGGIEDIDLMIQFNSIEESSKLIESISDKGEQLYSHALLYFKSGKMQEANKTLTQLIEEFPERRYTIALLLTKLGKIDSAVDWLEKVYANRSGSLVYINVEPGFKELRNNNRFKKLVEKMNFPK